MMPAPVPVLGSNFAPMIDFVVWVMVVSLAVGAAGIVIASFGHWSALFFSVPVTAFGVLLAIPAFQGGGPALLLLLVPFVTGASGLVLLASRWGSRRSRLETKGFPVVMSERRPRL